jgi:hypothetical protein
MIEQSTATTETKAQQPTENAAGAGFSAVSGSVVWVRMDLRSWVRNTITCALVLGAIYWVVWDIPAAQLHLGMLVGAWVMAAMNCVWGWLTYLECRRCEPDPEVMKMANQLRDFCNQWPTLEDDRRARNDRELWDEVERRRKRLIAEMDAQMPSKRNGKPQNSEASRRKET